MKRKILIGLIIGILLFLVIAKASIKDQSETINVQGKEVILCYQQTKNICVDYMGVHPDACADSVDNVHNWCHENYCLNKTLNCQGGGTNQCITEDSGKCKWVR